MTKTVMIADDHKILREGLKTLIDHHPGYTVLAEASDGHQALDLAHEIRPHVVIMDVAMPGLNGIEATRRILQDRPHTKILGLSMHNDKRYVTKMLQAGAVGYLLKGSSFEELSQALDTVISGQIYLSSEVAGAVVKDYVQKSEQNEPLLELTCREKEVLQLLSEGNSTKEIAIKLKVSPKTINAHRNQIMHKTKAKSVAELTKLALKEGLTTLEH